MSTDATIGSAVPPVDFMNPTADMIGRIQAGDLLRRVDEMSNLIRAAHGLVYCRAAKAVPGDVLWNEEIDANWAPVHLLAQAMALAEAIQSAPALYDWRVGAGLVANRSATTGGAA